MNLESWEKMSWFWGESDFLGAWPFTRIPFSELWENPLCFEWSEAESEMKTSSSSVMSLEQMLSSSFISFLFLNCRIRVVCILLCRGLLVLILGYLNDNNESLRVLLGRLSRTELLSLSLLFLTSWTRSLILSIPSMPSTSRLSPRPPF